MTVLPASAVPAINVLLPAWAKPAIRDAAPKKVFVTVPPPDWQVANIESPSEY
jgi:hypothetical protein